jgi:hypothetical protein
VAHRVEHGTHRYPKRSGGTAALVRIVGAAASCTGGVQKADWLTEANAFEFVDGAPPKLDTLRVILSADVTPADTRARFRLEDDLVLRNSSRS